MKKIVIILGKFIFNFYAIFALLLSIVIGVYVGNYMIWGSDEKRILGGVLSFFLSFALLVIPLFRIYLLMDINDNLKKLQASPRIIIKSRRKEEQNNKDSPREISEDDFEKL